MSEPTFTPVLAVDAVPEGGAVAVELGGQSILICNSHGDFFAIENRCSHAEEPLQCGRIRNGFIACPAHGARFDLETGEALTLPATASIRTFALRLVNNEIAVAL